MDGGDIMKYDENMQQYYYEYEGLIFVWDEEPDESFMDKVMLLSKNYHENLDEIIRFMIQDLEDMYGEVSEEEVKNNLGKPTIDCDNGRVSYCEQTFDDCHIFEFEFFDDEFLDLQYFSIDG